MAVKDGARDLLEKLEHPVVRWVLVGVGVLILLRLRLILFAAALPVMAYWHYSNQAEEAPEPDGAAGDGADDGTPWYPQDADDGVGKFDRNEFGAPDLDPAAEEVDPYDQSFWAGDSPGSDPARRSAPSRGPDPVKAKKDLGSPWDDDGDDFPAPKTGGSSAFTGTNDIDLDKFLDKTPAPNDVDLDKFLGKSGSSATDGIDLDKFLGSKDPFGGSGGMGGSGDLDFGLGSLGGGMGDDMDFLSSGFGGGKGGKGKGKRDKGKGGDREKGKGPQEPNPKQVFVAGIGDLAEDDIRMFFEDVGEVDRLKVLKNDEGQSKGVCFVTFRTEEQAQKALSLNGNDCMGRRITVRLAHGGKGKDDRGKGGPGGGGGFGGGFGGDRDRGGFGGGFGGDRDRGGFGGGFGGDRDRGPPMDFGARSERFGDAFGDDRGMDRREDRKGGKGKGRGGRNDRGELDDALEEALADSDGPVRAGDFDFAARRFLSELKSRDRIDSTSRFQEAMDMVIKYTSSKDRSSVRKWPAYIFTLLQKFDPKLWDELRERDAERRREKGGGGFGRGPRDDREAPGEDDVDRARRYAPPNDGETKQVLDRWGKPVVVS